MFLLHCIWSLTHLFPNAFEFNDSILLDIFDMTIDGRFFTLNVNHKLSQSQIEEENNNLFCYIINNAQLYESSQYQPIDSELILSEKKISVENWNYFWLRCQYLGIRGIPKDEEYLDLDINYW